MKDLPITQYLQDLSSDKPTPGGGTAAPMIAATGISSGMMAANMTLGKKKYASVENDIKAIVEKGESLRKDFEQLIEQDAIGFEPLSKAFKMPSSTEAEKEQKDIKMEEGLHEASKGPLETMDKTLEVLDLLEQLAEIGNKNLISDVGVGASCCKTALEASQLSVFSNTKLMKNEESKAKVVKRTEDTFREGTDKANAILETVYADM